MPYISSPNLSDLTQDDECLIIYDTKDYFPGNEWYYHIKNYGCLVYLPTGARDNEDIRTKDLQLCSRFDIFHSIKLSKNCNYFFFEDRRDIPRYFDDLKTQFDLHHLNQRNQIWFMISGAHQLMMSKKCARARIMKTRAMTILVWALNNIFNKSGNDGWGEVFNYVCKNKVLTYLFFFCDEETGFFERPKLTISN
jgi:hypothetical protein